MGVSLADHSQQQLQATLKLIASGIFETDDTD